MTQRKGRVSRRLRERVAKSAGYRCGYCLTPQSIAGYRLNIGLVAASTRRPLTVVSCETFQQGADGPDVTTGHQWVAVAAWR